VELIIGGIAGVLGVQIWCFCVFIFGSALGSFVTHIGPAGIWVYRLLLFAPGIVAFLALRRFDRPMALVVGGSAIAATIVNICSSQFETNPWQMPGEFPP
jgi:hypothetical protein